MLVAELSEQKQTKRKLFYDLSRCSLLWRVPIFAATQTQRWAVDSFHAFLFLVLFFHLTCFCSTDVISAGETNEMFVWLRSRMKSVPLCENITWTVNVQPAKRYKPSEKALFLPVCVADVSCVSAVRGRMGESEGEKMQSSACLSGHTIQHREKPFIQHSPPTPPSKLPSNSGWLSEWTRWHGSNHTTTPHPLTPTPNPPLVSALSQTLFVLHSFLLFLIPAHLSLLPKHPCLSCFLQTFLHLSTHIFPHNTVPTISISEPCCCDVLARRETFYTSSLPCCQFFSATSLPLSTPFYSSKLSPVLIPIIYQWSCVLREASVWTRWCMWGVSKCWTKNPELSFHLCKPCMNLNRVN